MSDESNAVKIAVGASFVPTGGGLLAVGVDVVSRVTTAPWWAIVLIAIGSTLLVVGICVLIPSKWWQAVRNRLRWFSRAARGQRKRQKEWAPILVCKELQTDYSVQDGKVRRCRLYFTLEMAPRYPYGTTKLDLRNAKVFVRQERLGGRGLPDKFSPVYNPATGDDVTQRTNVNVQCCKPFQYQVDYEYNIANVDDEKKYPNLNKEFNWEISAISAEIVGEGGYWEQFKLPDLGGTHYGPK